MVHSGSRGYGNDILTKHVERFRSAGLKIDSTEASDNLSDHNNAIQWAKVNRRIIANHFLGCIGYSGELVIDIVHNSVTQKNIDGNSFWIHRKGAAPNDMGAIIIQLD